MRTPFTIRDTGRYGRGVFAARDIRAGEVIHVFGGETLSARDLVARINAGAENIDDPLQIGVRTYLDLDELSRTFNHSCEPNAALRKRSELFAIRNIPKGDEITYDYSLTIAPTRWRMKCQCGAKTCRGMVGDVLSIPPSARARYRTIGAMQDYMKRLLTSVGRSGARRIPSYEHTLLATLRNTSNVEAV